MIQQICPYKDTCNHHTSLARQAIRKKGATVYLVTSGATKVEIRLCFPIYFPQGLLLTHFLLVTHTAKWNIKNKNQMLQALLLEQV